MAIPKNVFLGLIYKFPLTGITALRLCVLTSKNARLYALTQKERHAKACLSFWNPDHLTAEINSAYGNSPLRSELARDPARAALPEAELFCCQIRTGGAGKTQEGRLFPLARRARI